MIKKQHFLSRWKERGNIFFTLFAAVGVVGALGVGSVTLLKGPVQTMVKINQKQVTEEYSELGLRVMMANILQSNANCDADNKLEAAEWEDPTLPDTAPTGGGLFPSTYGTKITDPWGRRLGYCVWDHGSAIDDAGCGGATQKRLRGAASDDTQPFITIISAGPNQVFETSCNDYVDTTPADGNPDTPLLGRIANSDDLIVNYSTIDAQQAMGDNWVFTSNETADGDAAKTEQNLDFAQDVTFSGLLDLNKLGGGLTLPDFSGATCDGTTEGQMFRDSATNPPAVMVCDGGTFKAMSGSGGANNYAYDFDSENPNCTINNGGPFVDAGSFATLGNAFSVWSDKSYIYVGDYSTNGIRVLTHNGSSFNQVFSLATGDGIRGLWGDGTYIYAAAYSAGIRAYTFDGTTLTEVGNLITPDLTADVWGDGTYIYVADQASGVRAYTFNGSTFTEVGSYNTPGVAIAVWGDGTYIYVADQASGVRAYTFNGSTFTEVGSFDTSGAAEHVWGDGTYLYVADLGGGLKAYSFDGSTFTELATQATAGSAQGVWGDGTHIYLADGLGGIRAYTFDGTTFTAVDNFATTGYAYRTWGNGNYIYVANNNGGIHAFSGFECLSTTPDYSDRLDSPNTGVDYNYKAYAWGQEIGNSAALGDGGGTVDSTQPSPVLISGHNEFYKVRSNSIYNACGLKTDGSAWCWGINNAAEIGDGTKNITRDAPVAVIGNHKFIDIDITRSAGCGLKRNGSIWCWGHDFGGTLGDGLPAAQKLEPVQVITINDFVDFSMDSLGSVCGIRKNGEIWCWGNENYGELGNGSIVTSTQYSPIKVQTSISNFIKISGGDHFFCALTKTGNIWCWGQNNYHQLGQDSGGADIHIPVKVETNINDFIDISAGSHHTCALRENGEAYCWGRDYGGCLGNGPSITIDQSSPNKVLNIDDFIKIEAGSGFTCGVDSRGIGYCWGSDGGEHLGNGASGSVDQPTTTIDGLINITDISCRYSGCYAVTKEPKQAPDNAPTAPVIIEQKTSAGNTIGSHGLAINYNSTTTGDISGLAFAIDAQDTASTNLSSAIIEYGGSLNREGLRIKLNDGTGLYGKLRSNPTGAISLTPTGGSAGFSPKLSINTNVYSWNGTRFDNGLLLSDAIGANKPAYYGLDAVTGHAVILSGEDLLIQHSTTNGVTITPIASFVNAATPEFYGNMILQKNNGTATISAYTDTADETAAFKFFRYRGTKGTESVTLDKDHFGTIGFLGFDGTNYDANNTLKIYAQGVNPPSAGNVGSRLRIARTDGSNDGARLFKVGSAGNVTIENGSGAITGRLKVNGRTTADEAVKAGLDTTCAAADDEGTLRFTGTEYEYCKDDGGGGYFWESVVPDPTCKDDVKIIDLALGLEQTCALYSNGQVACWGDNTNGESGNGSINNPETNIIPLTTLKAKQISTAVGSVCVITDSGSIKCWGNGSNYRLGNGTSTNMPYPTSIASNKTYKKVTTGDNYACAIQENGLVDCWGGNGLGQSGLGDTTNRKVPTTNPYLSDIIDLSAGKRSICAVKSDRTVWCWGENSDAELGIGTTSAYETTPQPIMLDSSLDTFNDIVQVSVGGRDQGGIFLNGACALKSNGTVWCWGDNEVGQIGNGTISAIPTSLPTQVSGISNAIHISHSGATPCATLDDGTIKCWGRGTAGEIGNSSSLDQSTPQTVTGITNAVKTADAPASLHKCAILNDGRAKCWGNQNSNILGNGGSSSHINSPGDLISPLSCAADKYVFVTSDVYDGNLGGLKGADNICQAHADRANLPGRYLAWLSNNTNSPATRFNRALTDYKLINGTIIANGWFDLTDGTLDNPINLDENGVIRNYGVMTNTGIDGHITSTSTKDNCNNWKSNSSSINYSNRGASGSYLNQDWTASASSFACNTVARLYCFQQ